MDTLSNNTSKEAAIASDYVPENEPTQEQVAPPPNPVIQTPVSLQNKYLFLKELGHGAQAKIFLAVRLKDQQTVTIKQLNIGSVKTWKEYDLFQREAKVLESIKVPGVARFYEAIDCLEDEPPASYIVQEFIEGASLAQMLKSGHRFKVSEIYDIIIQLLKILAQLHAMTPLVIHRDIKPSNIMISPQKDGSYKVTLIDFGAVANPQVQSGGSTVAGTFGYMPPEQLMGHPEPASDIYALAAVAVELFTGKSPAVLPQKDFRLIFEPDMEQFPPALISILRKLLEPKTEERLKDIHHIIEAFEQFKDNNFTLKNIKDSDLDRDKQLNERITAIQSIGEDGNMDIWQALPDITPRPIPDVIYQYYKDKPNQKQLKQSKRIYVLKSVFKSLLFSIVFFSLWILNLLIYIITDFIPVLFIMPLVTCIKISHLPFNECYFTSENQSKGEDIKILFELIAQGRKTVATITDIRYIALNDKKCKSWNNLFLCKAPSFSIKYKFNPPDDCKSEDLVHECIVHTAPENHYKVGDPLPILYTINKQYFAETIQSIPFPFPLAKYNIVDIIHTQQNELADSNCESQDHLTPILQNIQNSELLTKELESHAWFINSDDLNTLLRIATQILDQYNESAHFNWMSFLSCSIHYTNENTSHKISNYIVHYLKKSPKAITNGAIKGLFNTNYTNYCDFPQPLTQAILDLYKSSRTPYHIKTTIEKHLRIPLKHANLLFNDPSLTALYAQFFAGWHCKMGVSDDGRHRSPKEENLQSAHHQAMTNYFQTCMGKNPKIDKQVFDKIWDNVYYWNPIPDEFWDVYFDVYQKAYPELQEHMKKLIFYGEVSPNTRTRLKEIGVKI